MELDERCFGLNLITVARLCGELQAPHSLVERCLRNVGATPAMTINGTPHYRVADAERAAEYLRSAAAEGQRIAGRAKPTIKARHKP